jgi:glycosyltransferase involved in cell wall biosynthesis
MATVDVIVPCYNYGRFLRECVGSVLSQEGADVRVLIIDDCSSDDSEQVGRALAAEDVRVEFRRHAVNRGHIATYNEGLEWVSADYTLLLSADDLLTPGALRRACEVMDAHPEVGFVYGNLIRWKTTEPKPVHDAARPASAAIIPGPAWIERLCDGGDPLTTSPELLVRTSLQKKLGTYRPDLPHWADVEMLMRFAAHASAAHVDCEQAYYRIHPTNMHHGYRGLREFEQRRTTFLALFREWGHLIPEAEKLKARALRHVAERACWRAHEALGRNDLAACRECLGFATDTDPTITSAKVYRRLRWKMVLGGRLWRLIGPLWRPRGARANGSGA